MVAGCEKGTCIERTGAARPTPVVSCEDLWKVFQIELCTDEFAKLTAELDRTMPAAARIIAKHPGRRGCSGSLILLPVGDGRWAPISEVDLTGVIFNINSPTEQET